MFDDTRGPDSAPDRSTTSLPPKRGLIRAIAHRLAGERPALPIEGRLATFEGATGWLNSEPLTPQRLRGRVVLVDLTDSGHVALERYRGRLHDVLGGYLAEIADEQVAALATATETLAQLVEVLQRRPAR